MTGFQGTIADYQAYRLDYPARLIARLAALAGLKPGDAVLDLGCGPGNLAIPLARMGMAVTAMDPEPEMLAAAISAAGDLPIRFVRGGSADLTAADGPFRLVTIGRAFHWMDRSATLAMLDRIVTPDGGVALLHDGHPLVEENNWFTALRRVSGKYGRAQAAHVKTRSAGGHRRYEPYLFASAFTRLDGLSVTTRTAITADAIVGRAFSTSVCARQALGERSASFEADLRAALREIAPDGSFIEIAEMVALLARRAE